MEEKKTKKRVYIMRGLPGAGKTTWSNELLKKSLGIERVAVASADQYWLEMDMAFDPARLKDAHGWCLKTAIGACQQGVPIVVVDNTNMRVWEMAPYVAVAKAYGYEVTFVIVGGPHRLVEYAQRNKSKLSIERLCQFLVGYEDVDKFPTHWTPYQLERIP